MRNPAAKIIAALGGYVAVADYLKVNPPTVYRWTYPRGRSCGTGGLIPAKYQAPLLSLSNQIGAGLTAADFIPDA